MATKPVLTYFQGRGLGELIRLTLAAAGVEFEDNFLQDRQQFLQLIEDGSLLFSQVPLLEIDGLKLVQSSAIARYIAHKHGLMGETPAEQAKIDMLYEGCRDFFHIGFAGADFSPTEDEKHKILATIKTKAKDRYLPVFDKVYQNSSTGFLVGDSLSLADVAWLEVLLWLHEIEPQFAVTFPSIAAFMNKMSSLPQINAFLSGPQRQPPPDKEYVATCKRILEM